MIGFNIGTAVAVVCLGAALVLYVSFVKERKRKYAEYLKKKDKTK